MIFKYDNPIHGDKIARLGEILTLVVHHMESDVYYLIVGIVVEKSVQLRYDDTSGHHRMSIGVDDSTIRVLQSSEKPPTSHEDNTAFINNVLELLNEVAVCDIFSGIGQGLSEYGSIVLFPISPTPSFGMMPPGFPMCSTLDPRNR